MTRSPIWVSAIAAIVGLTLTARPLAAQDRRPNDFGIRRYDYWADLCQELEQAGDHNEALDACERAIEIRSRPRRRTLPVWVSRGNALRNLGNYSEALASYNQVLEVDPNYSLIWMYQCEILLDQGRQELALAACDRGLEADGNWGDRSPSQAWITRGQVHRDRALDLAQRSQDSRSRFLLSIAGRERLPQGTPDHEAALEQLEAILWDLEDAQQSYERALTLTPDQSRAWAYHCQILTELGQYQQLHRLLGGEHPRTRSLDEQYSEAFESCEQAIALNRNWGESNGALGWLHKGQVLEAWGDKQDNFSQMARYFESAINAYERAIALNPEQPQSWLKQGRLLQQLGHYERALTSYEQTLSLNPEASQALAYRCHVLNHLGQHEAALNSCEQALDGDLAWDIEDLALTWTQRSSALIGQGDYEAALDSVERAIALYDYPVSTRVYSPPDDSKGPSVPESAVRRPTLSPDEIRTPEDPLDHCLGDLTSIVQRDFTRYIDPYRRALNNKAVSLWHLGRYEDAELYARLALNPRSVRVPGLALDDKNSLDIACNYPKAWFNYGRILSQLRRYQAAVRAYDISRNTYSIYIPPNRHRARPVSNSLSASSGLPVDITPTCDFILQSPAGRSNATRRLQERHRRMCFNLDLNQSAALWYTENCSRDGNGCSQTVARLETALRFKPNSFEAWFNYAIALSADSNYPEALEAFEQAEQRLSEEHESLRAEIRRGQARAWYRWARLQEQVAGDSSAQIEEALFLVEEALQRRPDYTEAIQLRDRLLERLSSRPRSINNTGEQ